MHIRTSASSSFALIFFLKVNLNFFFRHLKINPKIIPRLLHRPHYHKNPKTGDRRTANDNTNNTTCREFFG
jgi:hypothetical protein